jgi:hypothetical protein
MIAFIPRHLHAAPHDSDPRIGEDRVEQRRVSPVAVADEVPGRRLDVVQVHDQVAAA